MSDDESDNDEKLFPDVGTTASDNRSTRVRFFNACPFPVDIFWMNPQKQPTKYGSLTTKKWLDIQTFRNHPWVARRSFDGCKIKMNGKPIYWPKPALPNVITREPCVLTMKVQSLKEIVGRSLLRHDQKQIRNYMTNIPRELQFDLKSFVNRKIEYDEIVCRSIPVPPRNTRVPIPRQPPQ